MSEEKTLTRFEAGFLAGFCYARALKKAGVTWTPEHQEHFLLLLDEGLRMIGHKTEFEIEAADEIEQLLSGDFGTTEPDA